MSINIKTEGLIVLLLSMVVCSCKKEVAESGQTTSNQMHSLSSEPTESLRIGKDDLKIIFGERYEHRAVDTNETLPANRVYIQYKDFPKIDFPYLVVGTIHKNMNDELRLHFEDGNYEGQDLNKIVFEFYAERDSSGNAFIATVVGDRLKIYKRVIAEQDYLGRSYDLIAEYIATSKGLQLVFEMDTNEYVPNQLKQDFFEPLSFSKSQIRAFITNDVKVSFGDPKEYYELATKRYRDYRMVVDRMKYDLWDEEIDEENQDRFFKMKAKSFEGVYDTDAIDFDTEVLYVQRMVYANYEGTHVVVDFSNEEKSAYFYSAMITVKLLNNETNEVEYTNHQKIRLVQIKGFLYFDFFKDIK